MPAAVTVPVLALSGGIGGYAAWDSTRVDIPNVVGAPWTDAINELETLGLPVEKSVPADSTIDPNCYVVSTQDVPPSTRVVPGDTVVSLTVKEDQRHIPDVVGLSLTDATETLVDECFHEDVTTSWCVPEEFSGGEAALALRELRAETGFTYDKESGRLKNDDLEADPEWKVCDQTRVARSMFRSSLSVPIVLTVPLTTVPLPIGPTVQDALSQFARTDDGCALQHHISATFAPDPTALAGVSLPSLQQMTAWRVTELQPQAGHAAMCDSTVEVKVEWPSATMPQLLGLHHVPENATTTTAATATLEASGLIGSCGGKGTVTTQVPAPGTFVPLGTSVTCVAELVMPNIIGLDPVAASALLTDAGLSGFGSGSGVVVSQSPAAGTIVTGTGSVTYRAEQPRSTGGSAFYENCTAARAAGAAPLYRGEAGYRSGLDRDNDGIACE